MNVKRGRGSVAMGLFVLLSLIAGTGAVPAFPKPTELVTLEYATRTQPSDPLMVYWTVGDKLGYFAAEGLKASVVTVPGGEDAVRAGKMPITVTGSDTLIKLHHDDPNEQLTSFFSYTPFYHGAYVVMPDSPIKSIADFKGKKIGVASKAVSSYPTVRAEIRSLGVDPDKDIEWIVVPPGPAVAEALRKGDVAAVIMWDTLAVRTGQLLGTKLRYLPNASGFKRIGGPVLAARKDDLKQRKDLYVRYVKAFLKSWAFVDANRDCATKLHLRAYPQLVKPGQSEAHAIEDLQVAINARHSRMQVPDWATPKQLGFHYKDNWEPYVKVLGFPGFDVTTTYTNDIVRAAWQGLDLDKVREQAKTYCK